MAETIFKKIDKNPNWNDERSMLSSRKRFNLIARCRKIFNDHPRDPIYWNYRGEICRLDKYFDFVRYGGNKAFAATIRPNSSNPETVAIVNSDIFQLTLVGRRRQKKENGILKDFYELLKNA